MESIAIQHLTFSYKGDQPILNDVSLEFHFILQSSLADPLAVEKLPC